MYGGGLRIIYIKEKGWCLRWEINNEVLVYWQTISDGCA